MFNELDIVKAMERSDMVTATAPQGIEQRRERQRFEARRAILDATEALVIESAGRDFSMRSLGRRCGYSAPTIYHYFGDKDGLIDALVDERLAELGAALDELADASDPHQSLRDLMLLSVDFWVSRGDVARLIWAVSSEGTTRMPAVIDRVSERIGEALRALADQARLRDMEIDTARQIVGAMLQGLISQRMNQPDQPRSPDLSERAIDALLLGLLQPAPNGDAR